MIHTARQNPKFIRLVRKLRKLVDHAMIDTECVAVGILERLWHATAIGAIRGDIGRFDNEVIAEMCGWLGNADQLICLLVETGWLDESDEHRLLIHDWHEHAPSHVKGNANKVGGIFRATPIGHAPGATPIGHAHKADSQGMGLPNLTKPNLTKPNKEASASCPEPASPASEPQPKPVMVFPVVGKGPTEWPLTAAKLAEFGEAFPDLDILAEMRAARAWILNNSARRKTFGGMPKFLAGWLIKSQNSGRGSRAGPTASASGSYQGVNINQVFPD